MTSPDVTTAWEAERPAPQASVDGQVAGFLGLCLSIGAVLAPLAAWVWVGLADPPTVPLASDGGLYLGERALDQQSGVTLWFFVVGGCFGVVAGLAVCWFGRRFGWWGVVGVLALCMVGAVASRYVGVHVFGSDPKAAAGDAQVGESVRLGVQLDTWVAYLGWPIGGLLGALGSIACWNRSETSPEAPPPSPTLSLPS
ncbi:MAG: hypothetical protein WKF54_09345 [Nocardioidaceae bacterium]